MLAPLLLDMLIGTLVVLLVGWANDSIRANMHDREDYRDDKQPAFRHEIFSGRKQPGAHASTAAW
jgi:hypothetical protein